MAEAEGAIRVRKRRARRDSLRRKTLDWLWTAFLRVYTKATYVVPISLARLSGRLLGRAAYCLLPRRRRIGMSNLDLAYGDSLSRREKTRILKGSFENFGITAAEFSHIPDLQTKRGRRHVREADAECIDRSRGGIVVAGHLANWEWMAPCLVRLGFEVSEVVNQYRDPVRGDQIDSVRRSGGVRTIAKHRAIPKILRALRNGEMVGLLIDQSAREGARRVEVFGHPCWATAAPAHLALRTGFPIYLARMKRGKDDNYTLTISGPLEYEKTGDLDVDVSAYTQLLQSAIESLIRDSPEQWTWTHNRWKSRDELEARTEVLRSESYARAYAAAKALERASSD